MLRALHRPRRSTAQLARLRALIVAAIALATQVLLAGCGREATAPPVARGTPSPESIFEPAAQLTADPARTFTMMRQLGVARIRVNVPWASIAPDPHARTAPQFDASDPSAYPAKAWTTYDDIVREARARRIGIDFTLAGPSPLWASGRGAPRGGPYPQWKPSARAYGEFVRAVGKRYSGSFRPRGSTAPLPRIAFWAIWNEPNYGLNLGPQAIHQSTVEVSPGLYRGLLSAAWRALHETGHGHDTILIGELAPRGITVGDSPGNFGGMVPLRFLRALYCVDNDSHLLRGAAALQRGCPATAAGSARFPRDNPALFRASGFSVHPYAQGFAPNVATQEEPDYADLAAIPRLEDVLDTLQQAYGSSKRFPIYSTEYGYRTNPPESQFRAVPIDEAPYYLNWAEYLSWRDPRVSSYDQYLLRDSPAGNFATGIEFANGTPKPTFAAYRLPIYLPVRSAANGQQLEVWGCVRPARFVRLGTGSSQRVRIQFKPAGEGQFRTVRTVIIDDPFGYFDVRQGFSGSGAVRLAWSYPHGPEIFSRTVQLEGH
jgi:hypothetical protein